MPRQIRLTFLAQSVTVVADLLEEAAHETCEAVWNALPVSGLSHHASYSGSECVLVLPNKLRIAPENATSDVQPGDVCFTWFEAGASYGFAEEFAELCWFYDSDARPSMPEGPVPVNRFARISDGAEAFYAVCRRMRREGVKSLIIERVEETDPAARFAEVQHATIYRDHRVLAAFPHLVQIGSELLIGFTQHTRDRSSEASSDPRSLPMLVRSLDGGPTWAEPETIGSAPTHGYLQAFYSLPDGRLVARIAPTSGITREGSQDTYFVSSDRGRNWTAMRPEDVKSHQDPPPAPLRLPDGRLLTVSARQEHPRGVYGSISADGGGTWQTILLRHLPDSDMGSPSAYTLEDGRAACIYFACDGTPNGEPPGRGCGLYQTSFRLLP